MPDSIETKQANFTPGPWTLDEVRTSSGRAFRIGVGEMLTAGKGCCIIYDDYPGNPDNARAANARLIAAAPDLLALLRECREYFAQCETYNADATGNLDTRCMLALAKVEG